MKVQELIAELEKHPGDLDVVISLGEDISYDEAICVICEYPVIFQYKDTLQITNQT